jgi:hypothetical protein
MLKKLLALARYRFQGALYDLRLTYAEFLLSRIPREDVLGYPCSDFKRNEILRKKHPRAAAILDPILARERCRMVKELGGYDVS